MKIDLSSGSGTTKEQITNILRKQIISKELSPGEKISERMISEVFEVSTMPVKEAFQTLVAEGLLKTIPRRGTYVSKFAIDRLEQVSSIRSSMEGLAASFVASNISPKGLEKLDEYLSNSWEHLNNGNLEEFTKNNHKFHMEIINSCGNPYVTSIIKTVRKIDSSIDMEIKKNFLRYSFERSMQSHFEHRQIYEAISDHNSDLAEKLMIQHIRNSIKSKLRHKFIRDQAGE